MAMKKVMCRHKRLHYRDEWRRWRWWCSRCGKEWMSPWYLIEEKDLNNMKTK